MPSIPDLMEKQLDLLVSASEETPNAEPPGEVEESSDSVDTSASMSAAREAEHSIGETAEVISPPFYEDVDKYRKYAVQALDALKLPNISGAEIVAVHSRVTASGVRNRLPRPWGLVRLMALLVYDQTVRSLAGMPIRFTSLHRTLAYNAAIGGATRSQHPACTARDRALIGSGSRRSRVRKLAQIDLKLRGSRVDFSDDQMLAIHTVREDYALTSPPFSTRIYNEPFNPAGVGWDGAGYTHLGGIGQYNTFVHADCRGMARDW